MPIGLPPCRSRSRSVLTRVLMLVPEDNAEASFGRLGCIPTVAMLVGMR
jgi:hypothetical protein